MNKQFKPSFIYVILFISFSTLLPGETTKYLKPREIERPGLFTGDKSKVKPIGFTTNFIENKGQVGKDILYYAYIKEGVLQIKKEGVYLVPKDYSSKIDGKNIFKNITLLEFKDENDNYSIKGHKPYVTKYNYYPNMNLANKNKYEDISSFDYVIFHNVYHNIDLKIYKSEDRIEYDWILNPGSKISDIKFRPGELADMVIDDKGDICHKSKPDEIIHKKPLSYQLINDAKKPIDSEFAKISSDSFGFKAERYNPKYPLYIDPLVIISASYLGGTKDEYPKSQFVDENGNLYMVGMTISTDFPLVNSLEEPVENPNGYSALWIAKFDRDFKKPIYITLFGQQNQWQPDPKDCAVDSNGNLYVISDFLHWDRVCDSYGRCIDGYNAFFDIYGNVSTFTFGLNPEGQLLFISFLGGTDTEFCSSIKIDNNNNIYISGSTYSPDFPVKDAYQSSFGGISDIYLVKYTPFCKDIIYSTFYGDGYYDLGGPIALDISGAVYMVAEGINPMTEDDYWRVEKFNPNGGLVYDYWDAPHNYWSDIEYRYTSDIAVDDHNRANIVGLLPGKYITESYQDCDIFYSILNAQGTGFEYSTIFAGNNTDIAEEIEIDKSGDIYLSGETKSSDFPLVNSLKNKLDGLFDTFIIKIDHSTKEVIFSTLLGGYSTDFDSYGVDYFTHMNIGDDGTIYLSGLTNSDNLPVKNAYQYWITPPSEEGRTNDVYFLRLKWVTDLAAVMDSERMAGLAPASIKFSSNGSVSVGGEITNWDWDFGDTSLGSGAEITHQFESPGEYIVTLTVADNLGRSSSDKNSVFIYDKANISAEVTFEKNRVKANGKQNVYGSVFLKDSRNDSIIHLFLQPVLTIDNGNSGNETANGEFNRSFGKYEFQFPSGTPGKGKLTVKIDSYLLAEAEIEYLWPQPPIYFSGDVIVNRSLTRGQVKSVDLRWNANPDQPYQIRKYRVFRSINNNNWELLTELPYYIREYVDSAVPSPKNLKYAVSSVDIDGDESEKIIRTIEF